MKGRQVTGVLFFYQKFLLTITLVPLTDKSCEVSEGTLLLSLHLSHLESQKEGVVRVTRTKKVGGGLKNNEVRRR